MGGRAPYLYVTSSTSSSLSLEARWVDLFRVSLLDVLLLRRKCSGSCLDPTAVGSDRGAEVDDWTSGTVVIMGLESP